MQLDEMEKILIRELTEQEQKDLDEAFDEIFDEAFDEIWEEVWNDGKQTADL